MTQASGSTGSQAARELRAATKGGGASLRDADVLVVNLHRRYSGVSATMHALVPVQQRSRKVVVLDRGGMDLPGTIGLSGVFRHGWSRPPSGRRRIWHARRAGDLLLGLLLGKLLRQPWRYVYTSPSPRRHGLVWRSIVNRADAVIAVTEQAASFLDKHQAVIGHGVDVGSFLPPADKRAAWRESGLPGELGIGVFGRIRPNKGTHDYVEAMCRLLPERPGLCGVVAGACLPGDKDYLRGMQERIAAAGLEDRIVFLGDLRPPEIKRWYQRVAICVAPSYSEGFGLTPLEAMASGAAVVATRAGAYQTMVRPGLDGRIVDAGEPAQLLEALRSMTESTEALLAMGRNAREHVVSRHSIEREVEGIHAVYDSLP